MTGVLFVCLGNICRSPMAEQLLKEMLKREGMEKRVLVSSAGTSDEEAGNPLHSGSRRILQQKGIPVLPHRARKIDLQDYERYDYLIGMEKRNVEAMRRMFGGDPQGKLCRLLDFCETSGDIADPWYTGDFEATYRDVSRGCRALLKKLREGDGER